MPAILAESDAFVDLSDSELEGRWLDWKAAAGTDGDGRLIGYGTDSGPEGICYRADLFEKAGLPTDREEVAALFGTWDDYFAVGEEFVAKVPDTAWYDSSGGAAQAMLNQVEFPFEESDGTINVKNDELKAVWEAVTSNADKGLSTRLSQWSDDWTASFQNNGFATMACPGWMLGVIEGNAEGVKGWDMANAFPGGGGNWGGSFLVVPSQSEHPDEAREFAAWLTAPEQQPRRSRPRARSRARPTHWATRSSPTRSTRSSTTPRPARSCRTARWRSRCSRSRVRSTPTSCRPSRLR